MKFIKKVHKLIFILLMPMLIIPLQAAYQEVLLKNGELVPKPIVITVRMALNLLMEKHPMAVFHFIEKAKDQDYEMPAPSKKILTELAMLQDGKINDLVRSVILSSIEGEGLETRLVNPIQETCN